MPDGRTPREMEQPGYYNWAGRSDSAGGSGSESSDSSFLDLAESDPEDRGGAGPVRTPRTLYAVSSASDTLYMQVVLPDRKVFRIRVDETAARLDINPSTLPARLRAGAGGNILINSPEWDEKGISILEVSVTLPDGVTSIRDGAFEGWGLSSIVLPRTVERIESDAFRNCTSLREVTFLGTPPIDIDSAAFTGCSENITWRFSNGLEIKGGAGWGGASV